ncbi:MAG: hypothetical protein GY862_08355, partial [Gammaproteobacteria bacterium]|nr:hypothetical protein [Gammaproteobacteria bacterium]
HYHVPRLELADFAYRQLLGDPDEGGHYITVWDPRQTGKTWLMPACSTNINGKAGSQVKRASSCILFLCRREKHKF